ncbi:MAG: ABC transporter permease, partial [Lewinella sp.]|nr:ABC transporter permease [Lewinella sp.]
KCWVPGWQWYGADNQYHRWLSGMLHGDFGHSLRDQRPVAVRIGEAVRWTLQINGLAILFAYLLSIPLGVYAAAYVGRRFDRITSFVLFLLYSLPSFWVASLLILFLTTPEWLDIFPSMGVGEVGPEVGWWQRLSVRASHLFLPIFCLTYGSLAFISRQVRGSMIEVLGSDYIRTARAKGLSEGRVLWRHAFRNGLFPLITMFAGVLPAALAGSVVIEVIFNIPGMGRLTVDSILTKDWPVVYALLLLAGTLTLVGILLADLLYAWADPRVRLGKAKNATA